MRKPFCTLAKGLDQSDAVKRGLSLLLRNSAEKNCLITGQLAHDETIRCGHERDVYLSSLVVDFYGRLGDLHDATCWFTMMEERNIFSWNCLINAFAQCCQTTKAMQCFEQMQQECLIHNSATFAIVAAACASKGSLIQGTWLHARSQQSNSESHVVVQTALIRMYCNCGKLNKAQVVFEEMSEKDIVSWNAMLSALVVQGDSRSAFQLFTRMQMECVMQDKYTYATMLSACKNEKSLKAGKQLHSCVIKIGFEINNVIRIALINMYRKSGSISNAKAVFDTSPKQDLVVWSAVFTALSTEGNGEEIFILSGRLLEEALLPDKVILLGVLAECSSQQAVVQGRQLHACLLTTRLNSDMQMQTALLHMYGKLGMPLDAHLVFKNMCEHDTVSWNAMITVFSQHGFIVLAFQNLQQMQQQTFLPNKITFTSVLSCFVDTVSLLLGRHLHALLVSSGFIKDVFIGNALINMYCKCGSIGDAHELFNTMNLHDIISWNTLMAGYAQKGNISATFSLLSEMCGGGIKPDQVTYCTVLSMMASDVTYTASLNDVSTTAFTVADKNECIVNVEDSEDEKWGCVQDGWNSKCFLVDTNKNADFKDKFPLFVNKAAHVSYGENNRTVIEGMMLHSHILLNGLDKCDLVHNALIRFYGRCGDLEDCRYMFEGGSKEDVITWNIMVSACILQGNDKGAIQLFEQMQEEGIALDSISFLNIIDACGNAASFHHGQKMLMKAVHSGFDLDTPVGTAFVTLYAKCGMLAEARWLFDHLLERDVVAWTSMISIYAQFGNSEEALNLFKEMQSEGVMPDVVSFTSALNASELQSALFEGKLIYMCITQCQFELDSDVIIALIYMYGKCGSVLDAENIFSQVSEPHLPLWNALIASYAQQGNSRMVFLSLVWMLQQGLSPNNMTLIYVLCTCGRAGLVDEAFVCCLFVFEFLPSVEHCNCLVDLLGRAGQFYEAESFLKLMPLAPTAFSWASYLATCNQTSTKRAELAVRHLIEMDPVDSATYVTLSNIYAAAEESHDENLISIGAM